MATTCIIAGPRMTARLCLSPDCCHKQGQDTWSSGCTEAYLSSRTPCGWCP